MGKKEECFEWLETALKGCEKLDNSQFVRDRMEATVHMQIGNFYLGVHDFESAISHFRRQEEVCVKSGANQEGRVNMGASQARCALGQVYETLSEWQKAVLATQQWLETCRTLNKVRKSANYVQGEMQALKSLGSALYKLGKYEESLERFSELDSVCEGGEYKEEALLGMCKCRLKLSKKEEILKIGENEFAEEKRKLSFLCLRAFASLESGEERSVEKMEEILEECRKKEAYKEVNFLKKALTERHVRDGNVEKALQVFELNIQEKIVDIKVAILEFGRNGKLFCFYNEEGKWQCKQFQVDKKKLKKSLSSFLNNGYDSIKEATELLENPLEEVGRICVGKSSVICSSGCLLAFPFPQYLENKSRDVKVVLTKRLGQEVEQIMEIDPKNSHFHFFASKSSISQENGSNRTVGTKTDKSTDVLVVECPLFFEKFPRTTEKVGRVQVSKLDNFSLSDLVGDSSPKAFLIVRPQIVQWRSFQIAIESLLQKRTRFMSLFSGKTGEEPEFVKKIVHDLPKSAKEYKESVLLLQ